MNTPAFLTFTAPLLCGAGLTLLAQRGWQWLDRHGYLDDDPPYEPAPPVRHQRSHVKVVDGGGA